MRRFNWNRKSAAQSLPPAVLWSIILELSSPRRSPLWRPRLFVKRGIGERNKSHSQPRRDRFGPISFHGPFCCSLILLRAYCRQLLLSASPRHKFRWELMGHAQSRCFFSKNFVSYEDVFKTSEGYRCAIRQKKVSAENNITIEIIYKLK